MAEGNGRPIRYKIEVGVEQGSNAPYVKVTDKMAPFTPLVLSPEDAAWIGQALMQATVQILQSALHQCVQSQQKSGIVVLGR